MYPLTSFYGQLAFLHWRDATARGERKVDLRDHRQDSADAAEEPWVVRTYSELVDVVSFLAVMNHRLELAFRGQQSDWGAIWPTLYRETWTPPRWTGLGRVPITDRSLLMDRLTAMAPHVVSICERRGLPRWRTMRRVPEASWSVIQHYELWPTPLVDVTRSLRVAASFALGPVTTGDPYPRSQRRDGHVYVIGLPTRTNSISFSLEDHLLAARLDTVCPPSARRPHLQEGVLVTRFPGDAPPRPTPDRHYDLRRRTIAHIRLIDDGSAHPFWTPDHPLLTEASLLPNEADDPLAQDFEEAFSYVADASGVDWRRR